MPVRLLVRVVSAVAVVLLAVYLYLQSKAIVTNDTMSAIAPLKFITVPAISRHTATVIFVHGLGDTGNGWKPVADMFKRDPGLHHVKWVLPHSYVVYDSVHFST